MTNITEGSLITDNPLEHVITRGCTSGVITHGWVALGQPSTTEVTGRLDLIAAEIEKAYFMVPRTELPKTDVVHGGYGKLIEVRDSQRGRWSATDSPEHVRKIGLEYLAAAEAITGYQASAKAAEDARQLDEEADKLRLALYGADGDATDHVPWLNLATSRQDKYRRAARKARELHQPKS